MDQLTYKQRYYLQKKDTILAKQRARYDKDKRHESYVANRESIIEYQKALYHKKKNLKTEPTENNIENQS